MTTICHVVASIDDPSAGPSYSVRGLAEAQATGGEAISILTLSAWRAACVEVVPQSDQPKVSIKRYPLANGPLGRRMAHSPLMSAAVLAHAIHSDIIHGHGLWLLPNLYPSWAISRSGAHAKLVVAPRGMLGEAALEFSKWKKRAFWFLFQARALRYASCLHATSEQEFVDIRRFGLRNPVAIVPNGILIPTISSPRKGDDRMRTILSLGRIHPKKGLVQLVQAWSEIEARHQNWSLKIVGPSENGHAEEIKDLVQRLSLAHVSVEPPVFGDAKTKLLTEADVFILPSLNENFAMTVAEALAAGTPVISTKGAPWSGLNSHACGWWIDQGPRSIADALHRAMSLSPAELQEMGQRGRDWMAYEFSWPRAATQMREVYEWLQGRRERPATVPMD